VASLLYSQTRDFKFVAAFLGHSSVSMAQKTYVHLLVGAEDRAADAWTGRSEAPSPNLVARPSNSAQAP
jgi:integrase